MPTTSLIKAPIVTISRFKAHSRIDREDDDYVIAEKITAAQCQIESWLGFSFAERYESTSAIPYDLVHAVLVLTAHLYENREAGLVGEAIMMIPYSLRDTIAAHRDYFGAAKDT